jgi:hypothetical protein
VRARVAAEERQTSFNHERFELVSQKRGGVGERSENHLPAWFERHFMTCAFFSNSGFVFRTDSSCFRFGDGFAPRRLDGCHRQCPGGVATHGELRARLPDANCEWQAPNARSGPPQRSSAFGSDAPVFDRSSAKAKSGAFMPLAHPSDLHRTLTLNAPHPLSHRQYRLLLNARTLAQQRILFPFQSSRQH